MNVRAQLQWVVQRTEHRTWCQQSSIRRFLELSKTKEVKKEPGNSSKYEPLASWHIIPLEKFRHARILTHWLWQCLGKQWQYLTDEYIDKIEFFLVKFFKFSKRWVYLNSSASCLVVLKLFWIQIFRISSKTNMKKLLLLTPSMILWFWDSVFLQLFVFYLLLLCGMN